MGVVLDHGKLHRVAKRRGSTLSLPKNGGRLVARLSQANIDQRAPGNNDSAHTCAGSLSVLARLRPYAEPDMPQAGETV